MTLRRSTQRGLVAVVWLVLVALFWWWAQSREGTPGELLVAWLTRFGSGPQGALLLLTLYLLRPLLLLPITVLTVFAGFLFGAPWGLVYAMAAMLLSSSLAYALGRLWRGRKTSEGWRALRERTFETVLGSRLMFVPGDVVNYAAGALAVPFWPFLLATAVGGLPGTLMAVLAGAAVQGPFRFEGLRLEPRFLLASLALLVASLATSSWLRRRSRAQEAARRD